MGVEGIMSLPGAKDYKHEGGVCGKQKKEGIWNLRWEEGDRLIYYTNP